MIYLQADLSGIYRHRIAEELLEEVNDALELVQ